MIFRLLGLLGAGGEVGMVLAGGVPETARILYAGREWLARQRRHRPSSVGPSEVLSRLKALPGWPGFERQGLYGPRLERSAWRMQEAWATAVLGGLAGAREASSPAETGRLTLGARADLERQLEVLGLDSPLREKALEELEQELPRETPWRARFFKVLAGRLLKGGRSLVLVPIIHRLDPQRLEIREAWSWRDMSRGRLRARSAGPNPADWEGTPEEFALCFGENFW
jgi:hypothetical protein